MLTKKCLYKKTLKLFLILFLLNNLLLLPVLGTNDIVYSKINWDEILKESQYILKENERDILANFRYSIALANLGLIIEALEYFDYIKEFISLPEFNSRINPYLEQVNEKSTDIMLLNYTAFSAVINGNYRESLVFFNRILEIEKENIWIRNLLAATYLELAEYDNSKREAKKALEIKENNYSHLILAIVHYKTGNYISSLFELHSSGDLAKRVINF